MSIAHNQSMAPVTVTTTLDAPAEQVWAAVQSPSTLSFVSHGVLRFALDHRGAPWTEGETVTVRLFLFGVLPLWRHHLTVAEVDHERMQLRSEESGGPVSTWRHRIKVRPLDGDRCRYTDEIDIDAGILTAPVRAFAHLFYRVRQQRWRVLAPVLAGAAAARADTDDRTSRTTVEADAARGVSGGL
jgi:ligand-binding SRPBCC domain-containing protein